jgi:hypothetical protein
MPYNKAAKIIEAALAKSKVALAKGVPWNWIDQWHGNAGVIAKVAGISLALDSRGVAAVQGGLVSAVLPPALSWADAKGIAQKIDGLYVGSDHLNVKTNNVWKLIYQVSQRQVPYMAADGTIATRANFTVPCHNCGVVIPFEFLQVDHYDPQAGGQSLHLLKLLRAVGGTTAAPTGGKGSQYFASQNLTGLVLHPKARDRTYVHLATATAAAKWTTNARGIAFLSLLKYADGFDDGARMCKNSLLNLVPLCPECNRVKSDWVKPIQ